MIPDSVGPWIAGALVATLALIFRLAIHIGKTPSGVDTWYFLLYVREFQRTRRFPVELPQYILQPIEQTYPPLFPLFLSLFPVALLERWFWVISPGLDIVQLLLLYVSSLKITGSVSLAVLAAMVYAFTPQLVAENRNLNSRSFAALINSAMMLMLFRATVGPGWNLGWLAIALLLAVALLLAHKLTVQSFVFTSAVLSIVMLDWRFAAFAASAFVAAEIISFGFYGRMLQAHLEVLSVYRKRNLKLLGSHQVLDSPVYGQSQQGRRPYYQPGLRGYLKLALRLLGENPFILAMIIAPLPAARWDVMMYWWAASVLLLGLLTTFIQPLRIFGQGHLYMKLSAFPVGYILALRMEHWDELSWFTRGIFLSCFALSIFAIAYLYRYHRTKRTEQTHHLPEDLRAVSDYLQQKPGYDVMCLPLMYADYLAYSSGNRIYWGGHHSGFDMIEDMFPIFLKPLEDILKGPNNLLVLDTEYVDPRVLRLDRNAELLATFGSLQIYRVFANEAVAARKQGSDARAVPSFT